MNNMKYTIIIPALNPNDELIKLVNDLLTNGFNDIIVINDGSKKIYNNIFLSLPKCIKIINHNMNKGKGAALKSAIKVLNNTTDAFITVDADGQHKINDILKIKESLKNNDIVLGVRNFKSKNVPLRNRFGNKISSLVFKLKTGITLNDTQTGLRGINIKYKDFCLEIKGNRYEYEMNFLYNIAKKNINIKKVNIETIYDNNKNSHFNIIRDSFLIHKWIIFVLFLVILLILCLIILF